jgi:hypothetical protein
MKLRSHEYSFGDLFMTPQPDQPLGPSEIGQLLELLNASEERQDAAGNAPEALDEHEGATSITSFVEADRVALSVDRAGAVENKFAAHIVQGMSKLKARLTSSGD